MKKLNYKYLLGGLIFVLLIVAIVIGAIYAVTSYQNFMQEPTGFTPSISEEELAASYPVKPTDNTTVSYPVNSDEDSDGTLNPTAVNSSTALVTTANTIVSNQTTILFIKNGNIYSKSLSGTNETTILDAKEKILTFRASKLSNSIAFTTGGSIKVFNPKKPTEYSIVSTLYEYDFIQKKLTKIHSLKEGFDNGFSFGNNIESGSLVPLAYNDKGNAFVFNLPILTPLVTGISSSSNLASYNKHSAKVSILHGTPGQASYIDATWKGDLVVTTDIFYEGIDHLIFQLSPDSKTNKTPKTTETCYKFVGFSSDGTKVLCMDSLAGRNSKNEWYTRSSFPSLYDPITDKYTNLLNKKVSSLGQYVQDKLYVIDANTEAKYYSFKQIAPKSETVKVLDRIEKPRFTVNDFNYLPNSNTLVIKLVEYVTAAQGLRADKVTKLVAYNLSTNVLININVADTCEIGTLICLIHPRDAVGNFVILE